MSRIKIELPKQIMFTTEIDVRISDINYGGHLGNDALVSLIHEARVRFLAKCDCSEKDVFGKSIIMTDLAITYQNEVFYGEKVIIDIYPYDIKRCSFDLYYNLKNIEQSKEIARAKTQMTFFNYAKKTVVPIPIPFKNILMEKI